MATTHVDDYVPMGATEHHEAIQDAAAAAGDDGVVLFGAGKTYVVGQQVNQRDGQLWRTDDTANNANLQRADETKTTLAVAAALWATTVTVVDASGFSVKDYCSPVATGGGINDGQYQALRITAIAGNVITLNKPLDRAYAAGDDFVDRIIVVRMAAGSRVEDLNIDGNKAGCPTWVAWTQHHDVLIESASEGAELRRVDFSDSQGNAIYCVADDVTVRECTIDGANLAAVHIGSTNDFKWLNNEVSETGAEAARGGHTEGAFTISQDNHDVLISGGSFMDCETYAIARQHAGDNTGFTIEGVTFSGNDGVYDGRTKVGHAGTLGLKLDGCFFVDSGSVHLEGIGGLRLSGAVITDCTFDGSDLDVTALDGLVLKGLEFDADSTCTLTDSTVQETP